MEKKEHHPRVSRSYLELIVLLAFYTIFIGSCSMPDEGYSYIPLDPDCDSIPVFRFSLPVADSTASCATFIAARYDCRRIHSNFVTLAIEVISPYGEIFTETITLPITEHSQVEIKRSRLGIVDIIWPYREQIRASEGEWSISLTPLHADAKKWLHGVGFSYHFAD